MAVTKKIATLTLLAFMVLGYQNCMVEMSPSTPGAASIACSPDTATLTDFQTLENSILLPTGSLPSGKDACGSCHGQTSVNSGKAVFLLLGTAGANDTATSTKNYCAMELKGQARLAHPQDLSHSGGQYTDSDIASYFTFISAHF